MLEDRLPPARAEISDCIARKPGGRTWASRAACSTAALSCCSCFVVRLAKLNFKINDMSTCWMVQPADNDANDRVLPRGDICATSVPPALVLEFPTILDRTEPDQSSNALSLCLSSIDDFLSNLCFLLQQNTMFGAESELVSVFPDTDALLIRLLVAFGSRSSFAQISSPSMPPSAALSLLVLPIVLYENVECSCLSNFCLF